MVKKGKYNNEQDTIHLPRHYLDERLKTFDFQRSSSNELNFYPQFILYFKNEYDHPISRSGM